MVVKQQQQERREEEKERRNLKAEREENWMGDGMSGGELQR